LPAGQGRRDSGERGASRDQGQIDFGRCICGIVNCDGGRVAILRTIVVGDAQLDGESAAGDRVEGRRGPGCVIVLAVIVQIPRCVQVARRKTVTRTRMKGKGVFQPFENKLRFIQCSWYDPGFNS
jgi:hypothetical protein